ncbi:amidohydrolase family protein [Paraburkholderia bannensis]|uniref:amidohydrolase family protein n=1 Tax=Paraburkholderia bannensis TaxID=765414 RepID=UPI002AAFA8BA|nr:amidohydrolase family protein [Paraburkholderia bannensis]
MKRQIFVEDAVDSHVHYWDPGRGDYDWLTPALEQLYRVFGPSDLAPLREAAGITRTVLVQAAPTVDETHYLLDLARVDNSIAGVVGWVPMLQDDAPELIAKLATHSKFKGVRPMLHDLPDDQWIANPDLRPAVEALIEHDLSFDALIFHRHAPAVEAFAKRFPGLRIVIDHGGKPPIREGVSGWQDWADAIERLAALPNVHTKLSGLATEAGAGWDSATLERYVQHLLKTFGPERIMWGSDWPVLTINGDYTRWFDSAQTLLGSLTATHRNRIFKLNAVEFYRL